MGSIILEPPKIYLDTCHLIRIAKLRRKEDIPNETAYAIIDECIRERHFGLIFTPISALEWVDGGATLDSALEIAQVVDSAALQYELEGDTFVYLHEILSELKRSRPELVLPQFEILFVRDLTSKVARALTVLKEMVPEFFDPGDLTEEAGQFLPKEIPFFSAQDDVRIAWNFRQNRPSIYHGRVSGYKSAVEKERASFLESRSGKQDVVRWLKEFLKVDRIVSKLNPGIDVNSLLHQVDLSRCAALSLYLAACHKRVQAGDKPRDNDVDDWMSVSAIPYADVVLTERNLQHFVHQAQPSLVSKVTYDPNQSVKLFEKWLPQATGI